MDRPAQGLYALSPQRMKSPRFVPIVDVRVDKRSNRPDRLLQELSTASSGVRQPSVGSKKIFQTIPPTSYFPWYNSGIGDLGEFLQLAADPRSTVEFLMECDVPLVSTLIAGV